MDITIVGATATFAGGIARWTIDSGHNITIVGPSRAQAERFVNELGAGTPAGPEDGLNTELIVAALPHVCLLDMWHYYGEQLEGKILVAIGADRKTTEQLSRERPDVKIVAVQTAPKTGDVLLADVLRARENAGAKRA